MMKFIPKLHCTTGFLLMSFLVMAFTLIHTVLLGQNPQQAPLNPEFVKYHNGLNLLKAPNVDGHSLGLIPEPLLPNFANTTQKVLKATSFVTKYDLRTAGVGGTSLLTSVKDQGYCGACWTFSIVGAIEGYAKKVGKGEYDLSENNVKECNGFALGPCDGGNASMSSAYLARKSGPVSELNDPYKENAVGCKDEINPEFWVSDLRYLSNDRNTIKQSLLDYGALATSFYYDDAFYSSSTHTYYSPGATSTNHAVLIVGWDDDKVTAGGTGAWIIRNSWGTYWGENGFFYISYNDSKINSSVTTIQNIDNRVRNSTLFDYDKLGVMSSYGYSSNVAYGLVRFNSGDKNYTLKKLSTFIQSGPANVRFDVYANFNGTTLSNLMGSISEKTCDSPGYYTFDLATPIQVAANKDFYIKVYYNTVGYNYPVPVEAFSSGYANPEIESGKCWLSNSGSSWTAMGSNQTIKADLCIKAYGEYPPCTPPTIQASGLTASSLSNNSMTLNWTRGNGNAILVVAREGSPVDIDPFNENVFDANASFKGGAQLGTGNYVVYNGIGTSVNVRSLSEGTTYYYAIYEYNPVSNCFTTPALTGNFTAAGMSSYCTAGANTNTIGYISRVRLKKIDVQSNIKINGYEDYTSQIATMQVGESSTITIDRSDTFIRDSLLIWVDWNRDGDFSEVDENVYASTTSGKSYSTSFAPPAGAKIGMTRMRIRLFNNLYLPNSTSCGNSYNGEVEDYAIYVVTTVNQPYPPAAYSATNILQTTCTANWANSTVFKGFRLDVATDYAFTAFVSDYNNKDIGNVTSLSLTGLSANTTYYYRLKVYNANGVSAVSNIVAFTTLPFAPSAPSANTASNILQTGLTTQWSTAETASGYRLDVATDIGFTAFVSGYNDKDVGNVLKYSIPGLIVKSRYYYRVRAYNIVGTSGSSNIITVNTLTNPPAYPIGLKSSSCNDMLTLIWNKSTNPDVIRYFIYGDNSSDSIIKIDSTTNSASDTVKNISGLTRGQIYYFRISAVNYDGPESILSSQVSETIKTGVVPLIKAKWQDVLICSNLGDSIISYQWFKSGVAISNANTQNYVTNKLQGAYSVEVTDKNGCKNFSNVISITGTKSLSVFPNPASDSFALKINEVSEGRANVSIINVAGISVMEFQADNVNGEILKEISVRNLNPGIYIVKVLLDNEKLYYTKIVVTK